jgi:hypothetical protein
MTDGEGEVAGEVVVVAVDEEEELDELLPLDADEFVAELLAL